ncbi:MAG: class I SAM-dependent methyltransferase [Planctomycetes bacterium]|nr:class I SAM-dependent methyltransferase [Planctomycetota bacterium]
MSAVATDRDGGARGREAAYHAVLGVFSGRHFVAECLARQRQRGQLAGREAALALEIALGAVRHAVTIAHILKAVARFEERRVRPQLRAVLYTAVYSIVWLDRIPPFAAVNEAVELARRCVGGRSPAMVNAVLRNLTRAIARRRTVWQAGNAQQVRVGWEHACTFKCDVLPPAGDEHPALAHVAAATGESLTRFKTLVARFGQQRATELAWASQATPVTVLHANPLRLDSARFHELARAAFGTNVACRDNTAWLPSATHVVDTPLFREGLVHIQDPTAHAAAMLVDAQPGERVLDLCAAPGGKTVVLAQCMRDCGEIVACDVAPERLARVTENARRLGLMSIQTVQTTADGQVGDMPRQAFDAALVDAPCSNTGVIARRPEARRGLTRRKLDSLVALQYQLLHRAATLTGPAGRLVYSTCSIEPEENEQAVARFLRDHPAWRLDCAPTTLPIWGPALSDWRDGGYAARLVRMK